LFEEMNGQGENMLPTYHEKIQIFQEPPLSWETIARWMDRLEELLEARQEQEIVDHIREIVPEYSPSDKWATSRWNEMVPAGAEFSETGSLSAQGAAWMQ